MFVSDEANANVDSKDRVTLKSALSSYDTLPVNIKPKCKILKEISIRMISNTDRYQLISELWSIILGFICVQLFFQRNIPKLRIPFFCFIGTNVRFFSKTATRKARPTLLGYRKFYPQIETHIFWVPPVNRDVFFLAIWYVSVCEGIAVDHKIEFLKQKKKWSLYQSHCWYCLL